MKRYAVSYMESTGSFAYCRKVLRELIEEAMGAVGKVDEGKGGEGVRAILDRLVVE